MSLFDEFLSSFRERKLIFLLMEQPTAIFDANSM